MTDGLIGTFTLGRRGFWLMWVAFGTLIAALGEATIRLGNQHSTVAPWWPGAGLAVGVIVLLWPRRYELAGAVLLFSIVGNVLGGRSVPTAIGFAISNTAEALVAAWWMMRGREGRRAELGSLGDVGRLAMAAVIGATTIAIGAALTVELTTDGPVLTTAFRVFTSHVSAIVLLTPIAFLGRRSMADGRRGEIILNWAVLAATLTVLFLPVNVPKLPFTVIAPLVWCTVRLGQRWALLQLIVVGAVASGFTLVASGPFADAERSTDFNNGALQSFLVVCSMIVLCLGALNSERSLALARIRASEELFRGGFEEGLFGMLLLRCSAGRTSVVVANEVARNLLGARVGAPLGRDLVDDRLRTLSDIVVGVRPEDGWRGEVNHFVTPDVVRRYEVAVARFADRVDDSTVVCQFVDVTARHRAERELQRVAMRDHVTGLPNRAGFHAALDEELDARRDDGTGLAVVLVDIENFKLINDTEGHDTGDQVLVEVAERLQRAAGPDDVVARLGSDGFLVLCRGVASPADALAQAARIRQQVEGPIAATAAQRRIQVYIGVALRTRASTARDLLAHADLAIQVAKQSGHERTIVYSEELGARAEAQANLEAELVQAIAEQQFRLYLQPVIDLATTRIVAVEALIRWHHPEQGVLGPAAFLGAAERAGLMPILGTWVVDEACRLGAALVAAVGADAPVVHANVASRQLDDPRFADSVLAAIDRHHLEPARLLLEITESSLVEVTDALVGQLDRLVALGVGLAADDYGTGFSPLTHIVELPIEMIKVDKQFIATLHDKRSHAIVSSLAHLASHLGITVVAEGVETEEQEAGISSLGVPLGQGFRWSPAVPYDELLALLAVPSVRA